MLSRKPDATILGYAESADRLDPVFLSGVEGATADGFTVGSAKQMDEIPCNASVAGPGPVRPNPILFTC